MLLRNGCNVNAVSDDLETALMLAAENNHTKIVQLLLANGADIDAKDKNGSTAYDFAFMWNNQETEAFLVNFKLEKQIDKNIDSPVDEFKF